LPLVSVSVLRLPDCERDRFREEWLAHLNEVDGAFGKLRHALGCVTAVVDAKRAIEDRQSGRMASVPTFASSRFMRSWLTRSLAFLEAKNNREVLSAIGGLAMTGLWLFGLVTPFFVKNLPPTTVITATGHQDKFDAKAPGSGVDPLKSFASPLNTTFANSQSPVIDTSSVVGRVPSLGW
jgi:hypothetical protein